MKKLTLSQSALLGYFAKGGVVELCTTVCSQLGATNFSAGRPEQFSKTVLNASKPCRIQMMPHR